MQAIRSIALFLLVPALMAQKPTPAPDTGEKDIENRVQRLREGIVEGRLIRSHVRVLIRLKNGNRLRGIVKDGRLVERVEGLRFVQTDVNQTGAGIRIWYFDSTTNYVFVPFVDIADYRVQAKLTTQQVLAIEKELTEEARRKRDQEQAEKPEGEGEQPAEGTPPAGEGETGKEPPAPAGEGETKEGQGETKEPKLSEEQTKLFQLLQDYPPKDGWGEARRDEIKRRIAVIGAKPSAVELRFVEVFDQWQTAVKAFGVEQPQPEPGNTGRGRRR